MHPLDSLPADLAATAEERCRALRRAMEEAGAGWPLDPAREGGLARAALLSDFLYESLRADPPALAALLREGEADRPRAAEQTAVRVAEALASAADEEEAGCRLRRLRRRELCRIAWRDLAGLADLEETVRELSDLADACLHHGLAWLHERLCREAGVPEGPGGAPLGLTVIALGKLGGRELNFSSDVDLLFAYAADGETRGGPTAVPHGEFFTRLARRLVRLLDLPTAEGIVFRVDLRLRPFGESGPLVMSFDALEQYYQEQGREWERYAWIKARPAAGDRAAGEELLRRLQPFVYRRYLDYGAFEALREMKGLITREVARRGLEGNIKLGRGGIREIEFFGQSFQLLRGGLEPALRERAIRRVLAALVALGLIDEATRRLLDEAYVFLRTLEHRLQQRFDRQTHEIPRDPRELRLVAAGMGHADPEGLLAEFSRHREAVHGQFRLLLGPAEGDGEAAGSLEAELAALWEMRLAPPEAEALLRRAGHAAAAEALEVLQTLQEDPETRALSAAGRRRLDRLVPRIVLASARAANPLEALRRSCDILRAIERRTTYLALLLESPAALERLVTLAGASPFLASFIARHPVVLDELLVPEGRYRPVGREALLSELRGRLARTDPEDLEAQIEVLCVFQQTQVLKAAAADVSGQLALMRVSDVLSDIAEAVLAAVVDLAWGHLVARHGEPEARLDGVPCRPGFAAIAYGKLGGLELGYGSDLDLVFLHAGAGESTRGGPRPIDPAQFYNRLGQRVIHILTAHTRAGRLYEIDTRLRASGIAGILVQHVDAFGDYLRREAWTWEHQALIKARPVAGDPAVAARFQGVRRAVLGLPRPPEELRREVFAMRERMRRSAPAGSAAEFDLKQDPGGIVDIEFLVQLLTLRHARRVPELCAWTDTVRLIQTLSTFRILGEIEAHVLKHAYLIYRAAAHRLALLEKPPRVPAERFALLRSRVRQIWACVFPPRLS
ncbi:MAG: bifunctional [glutamate--ammonia ligase]-adenylyl-L-tyrosine phosphorylase/[glutamate--ammonia-ligase] adenylyltransferase [Desulfobacterales bacterium]